MEVRVGWILRNALLGSAICGVGLWGLLQFDAGKRLIIALVDSTPVPTAAASASPQEGRFEGLDTDRPQLATRLVPVITGVSQPTDLAVVPGHPDRAVVLSKGGTASLVDLQTGEHSPWITLEVATTSELGLLGIAFHPDFESSGRLFLNHTPPRGGGKAATVISERRTDPRTLSPPVQVGDLLSVDQPYQNHDAGQLAFGPDGMLYVGLGDGGFRNDPLGAGQDRSTLLGSMLRLSVDTPGAYTVPGDNPFVGTPGVRPEIWAYGLRNPWRYAFAPDGRLIVADVGQNTWEEIDLVSRGDNLGWRIREGASCFDPAEGCPTAGLTDPIYTYGREDGSSITGGVVWTAPGPLQGRYLFGDFVTGRLWALLLPEPGTPPATAGVTALGRFEIRPSAFARTADGQVWVADFIGGAIYRIEPR